MLIFLFTSYLHKSPDPVGLFAIQKLTPYHLTHMDFELLTTSITYIPKTPNDSGKDEHFIFLISFTVIRARNDVLRNIYKNLIILQN